MNSKGMGEKNEKVTLDDWRQEMKSFMDDAKLRDTTANVLSWLRCETKQLGLSYPPPLPARPSLYAHANHPLQPISFLD